jgi:hypothetical protein
MISGYGLSDQTQVYWDNWNNLRMLANMDINDYNVAFASALLTLVIRSSVTLDEIRCLSVRRVRKPRLAF